MSPKSQVPKNELEAFTSTLARQIRQQEKRRFWRLVAVAGALIIVVMFLLIRMQQNDENLRLELTKQCEARNTILDLQREEYRVLSTEADPEERHVWTKILSNLPSNVNCQDYFGKTR